MRASFVIGLLSFVACSSSESTAPSTSGDAGAADAAGSEADVGDSGSPSNTGIACAAEKCDKATDVCCLLANKNECTAKTDCGGAYLACSSPSSCNAGELCCGSFTAMGGHASCETTCASTRLCATKDDCKAGEACESQGAFSICRASGNGDGGPPPPPDGG